MKTGNTDNNTVNTTTVSTQQDMLRVVMRPQVLPTGHITKVASTMNTTAINNIMTRARLVMVAAVAVTPRRILRPSATSP